MAQTPILYQVDPAQHPESNLSQKQGTNTTQPILYAIPTSYSPSDNSYHATLFIFPLNGQVVSAQSPSYCYVWAEFCGKRGQNIDSEDHQTTAEPKNTFQPPRLHFTDKLQTLTSGFFCSIYPNPYHYHSANSIAQFLCHNPIAAFEDTSTIIHQLAQNFPNFPNFQNSQSSQNQPTQNAQNFQHSQNNMAHQLVPKFQNLTHQLAQNNINIASNSRFHSPFGCLGPKFVPMGLDISSNFGPGKAMPGGNVTMGTGNINTGINAGPIVMGNIHTNINTNINTNPITTTGNIHTNPITAKTAPATDSLLSFLPTVSTILTQQQPQQQQQQQTIQQQQQPHKMMANIFSPNNSTISAMSTPNHNTVGIGNLASNINTINSINNINNINNNINNTFSNNSSNASNISNTNNISNTGNISNISNTSSGSSNLFQSTTNLLRNLLHTTAPNTPKSTFHNALSTLNSMASSCLFYVSIINPPTPNDLSLLATIISLLSPSCRAFLDLTVTTTPTMTHPRSLPPPVSQDYLLLTQALGKYSHVTLFEWGAILSPFIKRTSDGSQGPTMPGSLSSSTPSSTSSTASTTALALQPFFAGNHVTAYLQQQPTGLPPFSLDHPKALHGGGSLSRVTAPGGSGGDTDWSVTSKQLQHQSQQVQQLQQQQQQQIPSASTTPLFSHIESSSASPWLFSFIQPRYRRLLHDFFRDKLSGAVTATQSTNTQGLNYNALSPFLTPNLAILPSYLLTQIPPRHHNQQSFQSYRVELLHALGTAAVLFDPLMLPSIPNNNINNTDYSHSHSIASQQLSHQQPPFLTNSILHNITPTAVPFSPSYTAAFQSTLPILSPLHANLSHQAPTSTLSFLVRNPSSTTSSGGIANPMTLFKPMNHNNATPTASSRLYTTNPLQLIHNPLSNLHPSNHPSNQSNPHIPLLPGSTGHGNMVGLHGPLTPQPLGMSLPTLPNPTVQNFSNEHKQFFPSLGAFAVTTPLKRPLPPISEPLILPPVNNDNSNTRVRGDSSQQQLQQQLQQQQEQQQQQQQQLSQQHQWDVDQSMTPLQPLGTPTEQQLHVPKRRCSRQKRQPTALSEDQLVSLDVHDEGDNADDDNDYDEDEEEDDDDDKKRGNIPLTTSRSHLNKQKREQRAHATSSDPGNNNILVVSSPSGPTPNIESGNLPRTLHRSGTGGLTFNKPLWSLTEYSAFGKDVKPTATPTYVRLDSLHPPLAVFSIGGSTGSIYGFHICPPPGGTVVPTAAALSITAANTIENGHSMMSNNNHNENNNHLPHFSDHSETEEERDNNINHTISAIHNTHHNDSSHESDNQSKTTKGKTRKRPTRSNGNLTNTPSVPVPPSTDTLFLGMINPMASTLASATTEKNEVINYSNYTRVDRRTKAGRGIDKLLLSAISYDFNLSKQIMNEKEGIIIPPGTALKPWPTTINGSKVNKLNAEATYHIYLEKQRIELLQLIEADLQQSGGVATFYSEGGPPTPSNSKTPSLTPKTQTPRTQTPKTSASPTTLPFHPDLYETLKTSEKIKAIQADGEGNTKTKNNNHNHCKTKTTKNNEDEKDDRHTPLLPLPHRSGSAISVIHDHNIPPTETSPVQQTFDLEYSGFGQISNRFTQSSKVSTTASVIPLAPPSLPASSLVTLQPKIANASKSLSYDEIARNKAQYFISARPLEGQDDEKTDK